MFPRKGIHTLFYSKRIKDRILKHKLLKHLFPNDKIKKTTK